MASELEERLERLERYFDDQRRTYSAQESNEANWMRLERLEAKIDWLIKKLIDDPEARAQERAKREYRNLVESGILDFRPS